MEQSFYICEHCGSVVTFMTNKGVPVMCCGQGMKALIPGTTDASLKSTCQSSPLREIRLRLRLDPPRTRWLRSTILNGSCLKPNRASS